MSYPSGFMKSNMLASGERWGKVLAAAQTGNRAMTWGRHAGDIYIV